MIFQHCAKVNVEKFPLREIERFVADTFKHVGTEFAKFHYGDGGITHIICHKAGSMQVEQGCPIIVESCYALRPFQVSFGKLFHYCLVELSIARQPEQRMLETINRKIQFALCLFQTFLTATGQIPNNCAIIYFRSTGTSHPCECPEVVKV